MKRSRASQSIACPLLPSKPKQYQDRISKGLINQRPDTVLQAKVRLAASPAETRAIIEQAANLQSGAPGTVFYAVGKEMMERAQASTGTERREWAEKAVEAFKNARSRNATDLKSQIAVAALSMLQATSKNC
jgi:hypothetical protein